MVVVVVVVDAEAIEAVVAAEEEEEDPRGAETAVINIAEVPVDRVVEEEVLDGVAAIVVEEVAAAVEVAVEAVQHRVWFFPLTVC